MKIRVLHLTTDSDIAGAEKLLIGIAQKYDQDKFQMLFATLRPEGKLHQYLRDLDFEAYSLGFQNVLMFPRAIYRLIKILKQSKIDILHTHLYHAGIIGQFVAKFFRMSKAIMTRHYSNLMYIYGNSFERFLDKRACRWTDHIIAISNGVKKVLVDLDKVAPSKITVIYNGVNLTEWQMPSLERRNQLKNEFPLNGYKIVGSVSILHPRKGHRYLLEAAKEISQIEDNVKILIVGDGPLKKYLHNLANNLNISKQVIFAGYQSNVVDFIAIMDILVQPSIEEGFGITILEAMAMGKPVIGTKVGGIPEIIQDGKSGILVPPADPSALAKAIKSLLENPSKAKEMGHTGKEIVKNNFTLDKMVKEYEEVYERILRKVN